MKIYFACDNQANEKYQKAYAGILQLLSDAGVIVMSNTASKHISSLTANDLQRISQTGEIMMDRVDGVIIEGSNDIPESGYLIALALAHQKPVLYLSERGKSISKNLLHLQKGKEASRLLYLEYYELKSFKKVIFEFLKKIEKGDVKQKANIKFTLRINPRIEKYLSWKTHNTKVTKADFLRELIEQIIDNDPDYQKYFGDE